MQRIAIPAADPARAATRPLLDAVKRQLGVVPNLMKTLGYVNEVARTEIDFPAVSLPNAA
jgi:hypothetical protein